MPTIAIVGAGPGLGLSIAKVFGAHGFKAALIARSTDHLDRLSATLGEEGIEATGFAADVADRESLTDALRQAEERFGAIDALEFSPYAGLLDSDPAEVTVESLGPQIEQNLYGAVAATGVVLPAMIERGAGTLLYTSGTGSIKPVPFLAEMNAAQAALRNWVLNLNTSLAEKGVYAGHIAIGVVIGDEGPAGYPCAPADQIAKLYWEMHSARSDQERTFTGADV